MAHPVVNEPHRIVVARTGHGWRATFDPDAGFEGEGSTGQRAVSKLYESVHLFGLRFERLKKSAEERQKKTAYYVENEPYIARLPDDERDAVTMYFGGHRTQSEIGAKFHVSQAAISYKLARAQERIDFMRSAPNVTSAEIRAALADHLEPMDVEILAVMAETSSQSETARILTLSVPTVHHGYSRAIKRLQKASEANAELRRYEDFFYCLKFNILRAVPCQTVRRAERARAR